MKKFKIPSPKLNNPTLCLLFFYAGAVLFLPLLALSPAVAALFGDTASVIYAIVIFILLSANILANSYYFESTSNFLASVTAWKCARLRFETDANGKTRAEAEKLISARITAKGTAHTPVNGYFSPLCVQYVSDGRKNFINKAFFPTHKLCLLYSVASLDQKLYSEIMASARKNISALMKDTRKKYGPRIATAVIILADRAEIDLSTLNAKADTYQNEIILPCVADFSSGKYVFDSLKFPCPLITRSYLADTETPVKNLAIDLTVKMLFGGKLPLEGNGNFLEWDGISLETPFLDYMRETYRKSDEPSEILPYFIPRETPIFRKNYLYFKKDGKTVAWEYWLDEKDERKIHVEVMYSFYVKPYYHKLDKPERLAIQGMISEELSKKGYKVIFH